MVIFIVNNHSKKKKISFNEVVPKSCNIKDAKYVVLIYYYPGCEMCEKLINQIPSMPKRIKFILFSLAEMHDLYNIKIKYRLNELSNVYSYQDLYLDIYNKMDIRTFPTIFIFNENGEILLKRNSYINIKREIKNIELND